MPEHSAWVSNTTSEKFEADVLQKSADVPVIVDFWAPWCGSCQQLGPVLEKIANDYAGKFLLVKVDIDREQEIAGAFGVQSIPFVLAFRDGQAVDQFVGLLPEDELCKWIDSILPSETEELIKRGLELEQTDPAAATEAFSKAAKLSPQDDAVKIRLAGLLAAQNRNEECRPIIAELEKRGYLEPEAEAIKAQLDLREAAADAGGVEEARKAALAAPEDLSRTLILADALAVSGEQREALDICLDLIHRDKGGIGTEAKETMVKIFEMPDTPPDLVSEYRRKLATAFY